MRVLAQQRRAPRWIERRRRHLDGCADRAHPSQCGMVDLHRHLAGSRLRGVEGLGVVENRPARDAGGIEARQPVGARGRDGDRLDRGGQRLAMGHAGRIIGESTVARPLAVTERLRELLERALVGGAHRDVAVLAAERLIRGAQAVGRPQRFGHTTPAEVLGGFPYRQRQAGVAERGVDVLAHARAIAVVQRCQDAGECEQARTQVGHGNAGLHRRTSRLAGDRHDARHSLRHQIETALAGPWTCLSVARNRRVDQARLGGRERRVVEAEPRHHARAEVLHDDVSAGDEPAERLTCVDPLQIEHHAEFAAVHRIERGALAAGTAGHRACRVAARRLHFDHARPHVRQ